MAPEPSSSPARDFRVVAFVGLIGLALTAALAMALWREGRRLDQDRFDAITTGLVEHLDTRTEKVEAMLLGLQRALSPHATNLTLLDWQEYMNQVSPQWNFPGLIALGYATNHAAVEVMKRLEPWLTRQRLLKRFYELPPDLPQSRQWSTWLLDVYRDGLTPNSATNTTRKLTNEGKFILTRFQECRGGPVFAHDGFFVMGDNGVLAAADIGPAAVRDAVASDELKITSRQAVLRSGEGQPVEAVTMLVPVAHPARREVWPTFKPSNVPSKVAEEWWLRWQLNAGLIFAHLDYAAILADIQGTAPREVEVEIFYNPSPVSGPSAADWLNPRPDGMRATKGSGLASFERMHQWAMYGDKWQLLFYTTPQFDRFSSKHRANWAAALGLVTTGLICALLTVQIRGRLVEKQRAAELREARDALQAAQSQRERLSHDLHDGAIQSIYAIQLALTGVEQEVEAVNPRVAQRLVDGRASLDVVIGELRAFIAEMKQEENPLPASSLAGVLQSLVQRLRPASAASIELECDANAGFELTPHQTVQLAAITREALSNSLRHAHASRITVRLEGPPDELILSVTDDGCGFDAEAAAGRGLGLDSMRRRAAEVQAELRIESKREHGTRILCRLARNADKRKEENREHKAAAVA